MAEQTDEGKVKSCLRGTDLIAAKMDGVVYCYVHNEHGDVIWLQEKGGICRAKYEYDAFGNERELYDGDESPFRYCGKYWDLSSGTYYLRNRSYRSTTGRFLAEDPICVGLNWYVYAGNNPVRNIDPSGLGYFDKDGKWRHDNWEHLGGYRRKDDPRLSFFENQPKYTPDSWNTDSVQPYTNCYAYAFNMMYDALTGKKFLLRTNEGFALQPDQLSGQYSPTTFNEE